MTAANTTLDLRVAGRPASVNPAFGSPARGDALGGWYRGLDYYAGQAGPVDQLTLHPGMLNRAGWYLLDDTGTAVGTVGDGLAARPVRAEPYQDGYLFGYGHDFRRGLADLRNLTGPSVLPPEWAFGTWFSKYQAYTAEDYQTGLLPALRKYDVPLDSLVIDTDWKAPNAWAGWNWNPTMFPDPRGFLAELGYCCDDSVVSTPGVSIVGTTNRGVTIDGGITQTMLVDDTSTEWGVPGVPDDHLAVQYWRDPLVVSATGTDSAVTVWFQRDVDPAATGYAGAITVEGLSGTVPGTIAETAPGTLVWTPAETLPPGVYTVTVDRVNSAGSSGVPMRRPYSFPFTVP